MSFSNDNRLDGLNPLSYVGVDPQVTVPLLVKDRRPTMNDFQNFTLGTIWIVSPESPSEEVWMLVYLRAGVATWVQLYPGGGGGGGTDTYNCDSGAANQVDGAISILGGVGSTTSGAGSTVTIIGDVSVASEFQTDSGTATPAAGVLEIVGGFNIQTSGASNVVTIGTTADITVSGDLMVDGTSEIIQDATIDNDITLDGSLQILGLSRGVVQTDAMGVFSSSEGTNGQLLIGATGGSPAWNTLSSSDGSIAITNGPNSIDLRNNAGGGGGSIIASTYFSAYQLNDVHITPVGGTYEIGAQGGATGILTVISNPGSNFYPGNGAGTPASYTAPATGYYSLTFQAGIKTQFLEDTKGWVYISTPARNYVGDGIVLLTDPRAPTYYSGAIQAYASFVVPLAMGDVVTFITAQDAPYTIYGTHPNTIWPYYPSALYSYIIGYRLS